MHLTWRDGLATVFVGAGAVLYALWLSGVDVGGVRVVAGVVLGTGLAASVTAVVYGVGAGLLQAPKTYLVIASLFGLAALVGGIVAIAGPNETMLAMLVGSTVALWAMSTVRHAVTAPAARPELSAEAPPEAPSLKAA